MIPRREWRIDASVPGSALRRHARLADPASRLRPDEPASAPPGVRQTPRRRQPASALMHFVERSGGTRSGDRGDRDPTVAGSPSRLRDRLRARFATSGRPRRCNRRAQTTASPRTRGWFAPGHGDEVIGTRSPGCTTATAPHLAHVYATSPGAVLTTTGHRQSCSAIPDAPAPRRRATADLSRA